MGCDCWVVGLFLLFGFDRDFVYWCDLVYGGRVGIWLFVLGIVGDNCIGYFGVGCFCKCVVCIVGGLVWCMGDLGVLYDYCKEGACLM